MSAVEFITLLVSSGVFVQAVSFAKWALSVEKRIDKLENHTGIEAKAK